MNKRKQRISVAIVSLIVVLLLLKSWVQVDVGEIGVVISFGVVQDGILNEGVHFKIPFVQTVVLMNVKIQKEVTDIEAYSSDLQKIRLSTVLNYHIIPNKVNLVYQKMGVEIKEVMIKPSIQEVTKAVLVRYTAMELGTKQSEVIQKIQHTLKDRLQLSNILLDSLSIHSLSFSKSNADLNKIKPTAKEIVLTNAERNLRRIKAEVEEEFPIQLRSREYGSHK